MIETYRIIPAVYDMDVTMGLFNLRIDGNTRGQWYKITKERADVRTQNTYFCFK